MAWAQWHGTCYFLAQAKTCTLPAGVESSHLRGARRLGIMSRENLLSLFRDFERFANDIAFVQRRGYRREAWTYRELVRVAITCARS